MKNLLPRILGFGLMSLLASACGETVNYDTQEKIVDASLASDGSAGGGDAIGGVIPSDGSGSGNGAGGSAANGNGTGGGSDAGASGGNGSQPALCRTAALLKKQETLVFPEIAPGTTCSFGSGENLSKKNSFFRAYLRQTQTVTLPTGALLCGFALKHEPAAMRYDDEMFFSVNNKLLLATKDYGEYFPTVDFFKSFSWNNLRDKIYESTENRSVYCAGGAEGLSHCGVPATETQGNIELTFGEEMNAKLSEALRKDNVLNFEWITTGDNDTSDCRHTEIDLSLELSYVIP